MNPRQPPTGRQIPVLFPYDMIHEMQDLADREFGGKLSRLIRESVALMLRANGGSDWTEDVKPIKAGRPFEGGKKT